MYSFGHSVLLTFRVHPFRRCAEERVRWKQFCVSHTQPWIDDNDISKLIYAHLRQLHDAADDGDDELIHGGKCQVL